MKKKPVDIFLNGVEKVGNALPHPATLFGIFALSVLVLSAIFSALDLTAIHPGTGEKYEVINLLSRNGIHLILTHMVTNFTEFAPLGIVIVAMLGIGLAEHSGLIAVLIRGLVLYSPEKLLTFIIVLAGILSNLASSVGYVLLVPLAGTIFMAIGRHPIAGMAAGFAGVSGGFSANLILGTIDPLLAGLSQEAARLVDPEYIVNPTANYFFMVASTFVIAILGTLVTEKIIVPRLGPYKNSELKEEKIDHLSPVEKKGIIRSGIVFAFFVALILIGILPKNGILRGEGGDLLQSPVLKGVVAVLFVVGGLMGIVYGVVTGKYKNDSDVMKGMSESMKSLSAYLVLVFFAAQFVEFFNWSNLGIILAIDGAEFIHGMNLGLIPLVLLFLVFSGLINLIMGSASAKWALMAPVFIPMFMFLGYTPELTQVVYRIGDSVTNVISPMMSFFALIIVYFQKYDKNAGIGTLVATMLPYSITFFIGWAILLVIWLLTGIPLGPGAGVHL
ncbi:MAG: aminobenzoyl-glutamate transporter [Marinilabiliales bacterium]|jgi:aminobenzoyl-glutamate transport protein|nr:MAG: aminobenzoyl-glutamate transporter [Marinilabiliales bacterium]